MVELVATSWEVVSELAALVFKEFNVYFELDYSGRLFLNQMDFHSHRVIER